MKTDIKINIHISAIIQAVHNVLKRLDLPKVMACGDIHGWINQTLDVLFKLLLMFMVFFSMEIS